MKAPRAGELVALLGAALIGVALALRWYETPAGSLDAWETFGAAVVLLIAAGVAGLALVGTTLLERSPAVPIAASVSATVFGLAGLVAALVRLIERPHGATGLCAGAWVGLGGALLVALGAWQSMRDERAGRYPPISPEPRRPPT